MHRLLLLLVIGMSCAINSRATVLAVSSTLDSGTGSFRDAVASATSSDTILINVKGTIELNSQVDISGFSSLTIIGPYAKHNMFTANAGWSGSMLYITGCADITIKGLGFGAGNGDTRHVELNGNSGRITFERCLFEASNLGTGNGGSTRVISSEALFLSCSFIDNAAVTGGALRAQSSSTLLLVNCTFSSNYATTNAGAVSLTGGTEAFIRFCTFVNNNSDGSIEAVRANGSTDVTVGNIAMGDNGDDRQIQLLGAVTTEGGNRIRLNSLLEGSFFTLDLSDVIGISVEMGLRSSLLEDGFGLKYWPITEISSDLINTNSLLASSPTFDCRNAPRALKGTGGTAFTDAGACEYTHLRVTNDSGDPGDDNSFLWAINSDQQKDLVHYIEFDIVSASDILLESDGNVENETYIIDGYSQPGSAIPGPHEVGIPGLTRAVIPIDLVGDDIGHGIRFQSGTDNSILQGVSVQNINTHAVETNALDVSFFGNEIGLDDAGNENGTPRSGLRINEGSTTVGGWEHWMRNVISGNGLGAATEKANINIDNGNNNTIQGNIIGGAPNGIAVTGADQTESGIIVLTANNTIGGSLINTGNIVVDNQFGIIFSASGDDNIVQGNKIGIGWDELTALGNSQEGIFFAGSDDNLVGGKISSQGNIIAHNRTGISLATSFSIAQRNQILGNAIYSNLVQGIDIENDDVVLPNDGLLDGSQQNQGIDHPELTSSENCAGDNTKTTYELSVPTGDYRVEFFTVTSPDPTNGEGEVFIGAHTVTVTSNPQTFTFDHGLTLSPGTTVSATVTGETSNQTSEFGTNAVVTAPLNPAFSFGPACAGESITPTITGDGGGTFRFGLPTPADGSTLNSSTGEFTGNTEGATYHIIYGFGGVCNTEDTVAVTITTVDAGFTYPDICSGDDGMPGVINEPGGMFSLSPSLGDGATITGSGGILTGGMEGVTYTIKYVVSVGSCTDSSEVDVTVNGVDESFTIADICPQVTSAPASPATPGGTFSFDPIPTDDEIMINPADGSITGGIEGEVYTVKYTVGSCSEESTQTVTVIETDETMTFNDFCPDSVGLPTSVATDGGTFSLPFDLGDDAMIDPSTGALSGAEEGVMYTVIYTVGTCAEKDTAYPTVITVTESFTFDDFCVVDDSSGTGPIAADPDVSNFLLFDAPDGVTINLETGIIYNPIEGDSYTVVDSANNMGCPQYDTLVVTAVDVDASFGYSTVCAGEVGNPDFVAVPGGEFLFTVDYGGMVSLDMDSGALTDGIGGATYTIRYIANVGTCLDSSEVDVFITNPNAEFSFPDFCPDLDSPAPIVESPDGVSSFDFEFSPLYGETINTTTGVISGAYEDSIYSIIHTKELDGCFDFDTVEVAVILVNEAVEYEDFCWEGASGDPLVLEDGGLFSFVFPGPGDDAEVDPFSGIITMASEGEVYEVVHTLTISGCTQTDTAFVTALGVNEDFTFDDFCPGGASPTPDPVTPGGTFDILSPLGDGAEINTTTGVITGGVEGTTYEVEYTVNTETGECTESSTEMVTVIPTDESFAFDNFCAEFGGTPYDIATDGGTFTYDPAVDPDASIDEETGTITGATGGVVYPVVYTVGECAETDTIMVTAFASEDGTFTLEDHCSNIAIEAEISGTIGGEFFFSPEPGDGSEINGDNGIITNSEGGTYTVKYITPGSAETCADTIFQTVILFPTPIITTLTSDIDIYCPYTEIGPLTVTEHTEAFKIYWYKSDPEGEILDSLFSYTPENLDLGNNTYYARPISEHGCIGDLENYTLFLSDTAGMRAIDDFAICLGSPAQLGASGGVTYNWVTTVPLGDYSIPNPVAFSLSEEMYAVTISNEEDCIVEDTLNVTFKDRSECAIEVYNAFSPNDDGTNDFWYIDNLINFVPNTVYIYNRWGNEVQRIENYDNINSYWDGTDKNGNPLPPSTYYYVVITDDPAQNQANWVQIVR